VRGPPVEDLADDVSPVKSFLDVLATLTWHEAAACRSTEVDCFADSSLEAKDGGDAEPESTQVLTEPS